MLLAAAVLIALAALLFYVAFPSCHYQPIGPIVCDSGRPCRAIRYSYVDSYLFICSVFYYQGKFIKTKLTGKKSQR